MSKLAARLIIAGAVLVVLITIAGLGVIIWAFQRNFIFHSGGRLGQGAVNVAVPTQPPDNSVVVFSFRYGGDRDARLYSIGFARALADRLYCAPKCITQQYTITELSEMCANHGFNFRTPISDQKARELGKAFGARYVITGDMHVSSKNAAIIANLIDTMNASRAVPVRLHGAIYDMPALQTQAVRSIIASMGLKLTSQQSAELAKPNFNKPETLLTYGKSFLSDNKTQVLALRWNALNNDPGSLFATVRLLEFYAFGPLTCPQIRQDTRLSALLARVNTQFSDNSHVAILKGLLLINQYEYQDAENTLRQVVSNDPDMARAHGALALVARNRMNGLLAIEEGKKAVALWPTNAITHVALAYDYSTAADNSRHGHYYSDMSSPVELIWAIDSKNCYRETLIASKLDRECYQAWACMLPVSRELSRRSDVETAFREMTRIRPKSGNAYVDYGFCFSPQWGGSSFQQERVMALADQNLGAGSIPALMVRAQILLSNAPSGKRVGGPDAAEVLRLANEITAKSKEQTEDVMLLQCRAYMLNRQRADLLNIAQKGFVKYGSQEWRYLLGMGYSFRYEDYHNIDDLKKAKDLYSEYTREIPYDPRGYVQWGWCLSHLGRGNEAKVKFLKALQLDPANESAKNKLQYVQ